MKTIDSLRLEKIKLLIIVKSDYEKLKDIYKFNARKKYQLCLFIIYFADTLVTS